MSCGDPGRCCTGSDCAANIGACKCQCGSSTWHYDNSCENGACWLTVNGEYECLPLNGCDCAHRNGEFSGPGTACPGDGGGPPPPDPPPPDPPDPGPITVYCCENTNGMCYPSPGFCAPGQTRYWSAEQCNRSCYPFGPPPDDPDPDPVGPCDPPCGACQDCINNACVNRCDPAKCCNGVCCAANETCVNGVCVAPCTPATCTWEYRSNFIGGPGGGYEPFLISSCLGGCTCDSPGFSPTFPPGGRVTRPCYVQGQAAGLSLPSSANAGPGTELKALLKYIGIVATPNCSCNARAAEMDRREAETPGWCAENIETILDWLKEQADARGLPFIRMGAKVLVRRAISNARKKAAQQDNNK